MDKSKVDDVKNTKKQFKVKGLTVDDEKQKPERKHSTDSTDSSEMPILDYYGPKKVEEVTPGSGSLEYSIANQNRCSSLTPISTCPLEPEIVVRNTITSKNSKK